MAESYSIESAKTIGAPVDGCWSQVHTYVPDDADKKEKRGMLLAVLVICGASEGVEAVTMGREVLGRLHEEYYGNLEGSAFERLSAAVLKVSQENEGIEIVAASLSQKSLNIAIFGEGKVLLKRGESFGFLLKGNGGLQTASGYFEENDLFLLGSDRFFKTVAEGVLRAAFASGSPSDAVEVIAPIILGRDDMADAAAVMALVKREEEIQIKPMETGRPEEPIETVPVVMHEPPTEREEEKGKFKQILSKINFSSKKAIFVQREGMKKKKNIIAAVVIFLAVLLAVSLFFGIKNRNKGQVAGDSTFLSPAGEIK